MLASIDDLLSLVRSVYGDRETPREFRVLQAVLAMKQGTPANTLHKAAATTVQRLDELAKADDPVSAVFKTTLDAAAGNEDLWKQRRQGLGQMLLGDLAERTFVRVYKTMLGSEELDLEDNRTRYNETDYRVLNGSKRQVFRLNIKFHGTLFDKAKAMVDLEPSDCFALATYKIWQGMEKQDKEELPYVFAVVSVPGLTADAAGAMIPEPLVHLAAFVYAAKFDKKRQVEDAIVRYVIEDPQPEAVHRAVAEAAQRIDAAEWRVISARKADLLLRDLLWKRVFAVRRRGFARTQVNMHFSLTGDLTSLRDFLELWRNRGPQGLASMLERGTV